MRDKLLKRIVNTTPDRVSGKVIEYLRIQCSKSKSTGYLDYGQFQ
jgi:hypothetical protein